MPDLQYFTAASDLKALRGSSGIEPLDPALFDAHRADAHLACVDPAGALQARASLWWNRTPSPNDEPTGLIGHYAATDADAGSALLEAACAELRRRGVTQAVGPMDGSTWRSYRLVTESGPEPPFFLEPDTPPDWPAHWTDAGFSPLARYASTLATELPTPDTLPCDLPDRSFRLRLFDPTAIDEELRLLYALSLAGFRNNLLYTPLPESDFLALYRPLLPFIRPELILILERKGTPAGFAFTLPDVLQARRGRPIDTAVFKTLAVHPGCRGLGLGRFLYDEVHRRASLLGYRRVISALMHEDNASLRFGTRTGRVMRRYTLYHRTLA